MFTYSPKKSKAVLAGLLSCILVLNMGFSLFNMSAKAVSKSELNALKHQQEELAKQKADIQKQADAANGKVLSQQEKLATLNAKLDVTNSQLENLSEQITIYTNTIAEMENELNLNEQRQQELIDKYKLCMRAMEENGTFSYISILFEATSFADFLSRVDCVQEIMAYNDRLIKDVQDATAKTEKAKADMEAEIAEQEGVFTAYQEKQVDLAEQQAEAQAILDSLAADSADYQNQLDSIKTLQNSINAKISDMKEKLAEQERIRAEQAAAARLAAERANSWYGDSTGTGTGQDIIDYAKTFLGIPYVYGGTSPSGFDCSGLVYYCYKHFGYSINRTASGQALNGKAVSSMELQPGDIIIFTAPRGGYIGHCGMYIGNGKFIHAPHTGDVIKISSLSDRYYANHYYSARRIIKG